MLLFNHQFPKYQSAITVMTHGEECHRKGKREVTRERKPIDHVFLALLLLILHANCLLSGHGDEVQSSEESGNGDGGFASLPPCLPASGGSATGQFLLLYLLRCV